MWVPYMCMGISACVFCVYLFTLCTCMVTVDTVNPESAVVWVIDFPVVVSGSQSYRIVPSYFIIYIYKTVQMRTLHCGMV